MGISPTEAGTNTARTMQYCSSDPGRPAPVYFELVGTNIRVMGSMHLLPAGSPGLPEWVANAYAWCDELILESDPSAVRSQFHPTPNVDLKDRLTPATWEVLQDMWPQSADFPPLTAIQPWAVFLFASALASTTSEGVEASLFRWAAKDSKGVQFLESAAQVSAALDDAPIEEVLQSIEFLISDLSIPQQNIEAMYEAWIEKDLASLYKVAVHSPSLRFPGIRQAVLQGRNRSWAPILQSQINTPRRTLVSVGALHLHGPGNLLTVLGRKAKVIHEAG